MLRILMLSDWGLEIDYGLVWFGSDTFIYLMHLITYFFLLSHIPNHLVITRTPHPSLRQLQSQL